MVSVGFGAFTGMIVMLAAVTLPMLAVWAVVRLLSGLGWVVSGLGRGVGRGVSGGFGRVGRFLRAELRDALNVVGGLLTAVIIAPLSLVNVFIGRWSAASHYGRALEDEITSAGVGLYRLALGNPIQLLGLSPLTAGLEQRLPELVQRVPSREPSKRRKRGFTGYTVTGTLPSGGSGARLYLARPGRDKVRAFQAAGHTDPGQVVIKSFALEEGSTLPQIVRESRALECASRLGLVLEHELEGSSFHYVMPYVPGERLDDVTRRMHAGAPAKGLERRQLAQVLGFAADLLHSLDRFHSGGLWHKDIKPSNIIVSGHKVHLVDLGLVTPLASAMTLTTHGTEYYRDPEMVRLALQGVKVHEVAGAKFDIYSTGAVLYSLIENDFPAHGNLSRISKACPDALAMIVRRAMADMDTRYTSAREMLEDVRVLMRAQDPFQVRVAELPSMGGRPIDPPSAAESFEAEPRRAAEVASYRARTSEPLPSEDSIMGAGAPVGASRKSARPRHSRVGRAVVLGGAVAGFALLGALFTAKTRRTVLSNASVSWPRTEIVRTGNDELPVQTHVLRLSPEGFRIQTTSHGHATTISVPPAPQAPTRSTARVAAGALSSEQAEASDETELPIWAKPFARLASGSQVLVLRDLRARAKEFDLPAIRATIEGAGLRVLDSSSEGEQGNLERVIGGDALSMIGLGTPDDAEILERLRAYLDRDERLEGMLWLWTDASGPRYISLIDRDASAPDATPVLSSH